MKALIESSGTFTKPSGLQGLLVRVRGAGSARANANSSACGSGGSGGNSFVVLKLGEGT